MLCSHCSEPIKPVVAIDIDGTLADYYSHFKEFSEAWTGISIPADWTYTGSEAYWYWWTETFKPHDRSSFRACKLAYRQGGMKRTQPLVRGARAFMNMILSNLDVEVWLTTTRPHDRFDRVDPDTREWLRRHYIPFAGLLYDRDKYAVLAERVDTARVIAVLDDLPGQVERAAERFGTEAAIWVRAPWNSGAVEPVHYSEAPSLELAYGLIEERYEQWRMKNEVPA